MFEKLGATIYRRRWAVLIAGVVFMIASGVLGTSVFGSLKTGGYNNPGAESERVAETLSKDLGRDDRTLIVLFTSKDGTAADSAAFKEEVEATLGKIEGNESVGKVMTYYSTGAKQLLSNDKTSTYAVVGIDGDDDTQLKVMKELRPLLTSDKVQVRLGVTRR